LSQLLPYEQSIADKLSHAGIPDMADDIWASIEEGLGPDGPPDDFGGNDPVSGSPVGAGWTTWSGLSVFMGVMVTIFLGGKDPAADKTTSSKQVPGPAVITTIEENKEDSVASPTPSPVKTVASYKTNMPVILDYPLTRQRDSIAGIPFSFAQPTDSIVDNGLTIQLPKIEDQLTKGKGVKVKNSEYKIVPNKKDS
jgi:hypothetical protein